jgi:hypothetical protein
VSVKSLRTEGFDTSFSSNLENNQTLGFNKNLPVSASKKISQPYWLQYPLLEGSFDVRDQTVIGKAENDPSFVATFTVTIEGVDFIINRAIQYKVVDPVKGELYQPVVVLPKVELNYAKENLVSLNGAPAKALLHFKSNLRDTASYSINQHYSKNWTVDHPVIKYTPAGNLESSSVATFTSNTKDVNTTEPATLTTSDGQYDGYTKVIAYDHIPTITYLPKAKANLVKLEIKTVGKNIGYIEGAGDKVPDALTAMGYNVTFLNEYDITEDNLKNFDAIVVGVRAYNIYEYLTNKNDVLNRYIENGGNVVVQYIKSNQVGSRRISSGPISFQR